jgi:GAF domain-containing protein
MNNHHKAERRLTMQPAPMPADELDRLDVLRRGGWLDQAPKASFNRVTASVAQLLGTPVALVSLLDQHRQWYLSRFGLETSETARDISFCGHVVAQRNTLRVVDTWVDPRFGGNPLVTGEPHIRAYLGAPIFGEQGQPLGTLCVLDRRVREFSAQDQKILERCARAVEALMKG